MPKLIPYKEYSGLKNMSIDISIHNESIKNKAKPILRLYGWEKPTLTIGRNQALTGINTDYCRLNNIEIVKRPTGGRAVLHDKELTYCFITHEDFLENGKSVILSYREISQALITGFKLLNIDLSFPETKKVSVQNDFCMALSTGADLNYKGKKIIGSAQFRKQNYILQHGSILLDIDPKMLENIFYSENPDKNLITIKQINPAIADINIISRAVISGFEAIFGCKYVQY
ncbi:MAG: lipoate--protein ligase family protein [Candidatus Gastranaerophilales bacterium]|nr:lipoate--protein ligase family protein [Candidatus Gastranaerophilales bacterium]